MRVTKEQLVNGLVEYIEEAVVPKIESKAKKILVDVGVQSIKSNPKLVDKVLENETIKALLEKDEKGEYEIGELTKTLSESVKKYGPYPVVIPSVPFIAPTEDEFAFSTEDIADLIKKIERSS